MDWLGAGWGWFEEGSVDQGESEPLLILLELVVIGFEHPRFYYGGEVSFKQLEPAGGRPRKVGGEWEWKWGWGEGNSTSQLSVRSLPDYRKDASTGGVTRQGHLLRCS